jgi:hypothetical protein
MSCVRTGAILSARRRKEVVMTQQRHAEAGDRIVVQGHWVGQESRTGDILEVIGSGEHERYRVRWEDGHESILTPGSDAVIEHVEPSGYDEPVLSHDP